MLHLYREYFIHMSICHITILFMDYITKNMFLTGQLCYLTSFCVDLINKAKHVFNKNI